MGYDGLKTPCALAALFLTTGIRLLTVMMNFDLPEHFWQFIRRLGGDQCHITTTFELESSPLAAKSKFPFAAQVLNHDPGVS